MRVRLLGPVRLEVEGERRVLRGRRQRTVLALLALRRDAWITTDALADELWNIELPQTWTNSIQRFVSDIRGALGVDRWRLESSTGRYRLSLGAGQLDSLEASLQIEAGQRLVSRGAFQLAAETLEHALTFFRGELLSDVADVPTISLAKHRFSEMYRSGAESLWHARVELGGVENAVVELSEFVAREPHRERLRGLLIVALYRTGRQADALREYDDFRRVLADSSGLRPSLELQELERQMLDQVDDVFVPWSSTTIELAGNVAGASQVHSSARPDESAPQPLVGRAEDLTSVERLIGSNAVVCLFGPAGVGKSALALDLMATTRWLFPDGAARYDLGSLETYGDVQSTLLTHLGVTSLGMLTLALADERRLIVLDNADSVVEDTLRLCDTISASCPNVRFVVATRRRSDRANVATHVLTPLALPLGGEFAAIVSSPAVKLYLDVHAAAGWSLELNPRNATRVAEACRRLDGLPLALELAARQPHVFGHLAPEMGQDEDDPLLVTPDRPHGLSQHVDLNTAIRLSIDALTVEDRDAFLRLSVLPRVFSPSAAHRVLTSTVESDSASIPTIERLVNSSLLTRRDQGHGVSYELLTTVHQTARGLASRDITRTSNQSIREHSLDVVSQVFRLSRDAWSSEPIKLLVEEFPVLAQSSLQCIDDGEPSDAGVLMTALFAMVNDHSVAVASLGARFLDRWPDPEGDMWPAAVAITASANLVQGNHHLARELAAKVLRAPEPGFGGCLARRVRFPLALADGNTQLAIDEIDLSIETLRTLRLPPFLTEMEIFRAGVLDKLGRHELALEAINELCDRPSESHNVITRLEAQLMAGYLWLRFDLVRAKNLLQEALAIAESLNLRAGISIIHSCFAIAAMLDGQVEVARAELQRALDEAVRLSALADLWSVLELIGVHGRSQGGAVAVLGESLLAAAAATYTAPFAHVDTAAHFGSEAVARPKPLDLPTAVDLSRRILAAR